MSRCDFIDFRLFFGCFATNLVYFVAQMGPLELADFIGLDTCLAICKVLHDGLGDGTQIAIQMPTCFGFFY